MDVGLKESSVIIGQGEKPMSEAVEREIEATRSLLQRVISEESEARREIQQARQTEMFTRAEQPIDPEVYAESVYFRWGEKLRPSEADLALRNRWFKFLGKVPESMVVRDCKSIEAIFYVNLAEKRTTPVPPECGKIFFTASPEMPISIDKALINPKILQPLIIRAFNLPEREHSEWKKGRDY
ncbi:hypothetical protein M1403_04080 [Patescibacteria group bacterium]|nr:hypothetical protein [Patescibacteria group bacterium]